MQFETNIPNKGILSTAMCSRRHSLPVQTEAFVRLFNTTMEKSNVDESSSTVSQPNGQVSRHPSSVPFPSPTIGPQFIRQYSFGERRRSLKQHQLHSTDSQYATGAMRAIAANRRRLFAGNRSPMISAVESLSSSESSHSGSVGGGSMEKSGGSSFDHDLAVSSANKSFGLSDPHLGKINTHDSRVVNVSTIDTQALFELQHDTSITAMKTEFTNQNQHRSVTFQVSGSSESSEHNKDDFQMDLEQCKNLVNIIHRNLNNTDNISSSRRGSAPSNLLLNQINANKLAIAAHSRSNKKRDDNIAAHNENNIPTHSTYDIDNYDHVSTSSRRGSLPVNLNPVTESRNVTNNSIYRASITENKKSANREYRLNYAAKRRQMAHCKKLLDKNHSLDIGMVASPSSCRPPMLSQCSSLRSSSFSGVGHNGNYNEDDSNFITTDLNYLDNYTSPIPDYNLSSNTNDNMDGLAHILMNRRGSAPVHRQSSLTSVPGNDKRASFFISNEEDGHTYFSKDNLNVSVGAMTERFFKEQQGTVQTNNHNSTPSLSTLLAREHINAVQSRIQLLQNSSSSAGYCWNSNSSSSSSKPNLNSISNPHHGLLNNAVNNCISNGNESSLMDGSINTTNSNSANIRRGSLPTDFHFYNSFGVC
jgi:hypothetical protein